MNNQKPIWRFPTVFEGGGLGFNNGDTQIFKDDSIQSLAREVCQNSIDAKHKGNNVPVIVEFITFNIKKEEFPGYNEFKEIIEKELEYCKSFYKNNKSAINYYQEALNTLNNDEILCLRISDYNTTGLTCNNNSRNNNWLNFVVHSGTNDKPEEAAGSFGLGKNAMYACSKLGTLYVSTYTDEMEKKSECVSKLSEFQYSENTNIHGLGFYGLYSDPRSDEKDKPIYELCNIDKKFIERENRTGTDIYILGFELQANEIFSESKDTYSKFEADICAALIDNYFKSIYENKLIVKINNITIDTNNIMKIFEKIYNSNPGLFNSNTKDYLDVLTDQKDTHIYPICIMNPEIPDAELRIKLSPTYHNKIAMLKNTGMKIFDKGNWPQKTIFSGMLTLATNEVNGYFKQMESPKHDSWSVEKIKKDPTAKIKYERMTNQIKEIIKQLAKDNIPKTMDVAGLGEFLPDDISIGQEENEKENINDEYAEKIEVIERIPLPNIDDIIDNQEGNDMSLDPSGEPEDKGKFEAHYGEKTGDGHGGGEKHEKGAKDGQGKLLISKDKIVKNIKKRVFYSNGYYSLIIHSPEEMKDCKVVIQYAGEQTNYIPIITDAFKDKLVFGTKKVYHEANIIQIGKLLKDETAKINFKLDDDDCWSLEVIVYES